MNDEKTVCVSVFNTDAEADMARIALETNGIECFITKDDCGGMRPYMQLVTGVRLMVMESEAEHASDVLKENKTQ